MFSKTIALTIAAASFSIGDVTLTPAMANYAPCYENPNGPGCPGETKQNMTTHYYRGAEHQTRQMTHHHG